MEKFYFDVVSFNEIEDEERTLRLQALAVEERSVHTMINEGDEDLLKDYFSIDDTEW